MSQYTPMYTKPYPDGWKNKPDETTPVTAEIMDAYDNAIETIEEYLRVNPIEQAEAADVDLNNLVVGNSISLGRKADTTTGPFSFAAGGQVTASAPCAHAEGLMTLASSDASHAEGQGTVAQGSYSHAEGQQTKATSLGAHAERKRKAHILTRKE